MTLTNYIKLGAECGMLPRHLDGARIEWYQSDAEKREVFRAR